MSPQRFFDVAVLLLILLVVGGFSPIKTVVMVYTKLLCMITTGFAVTAFAKAIQFIGIITSPLPAVLKPLPVFIVSRNSVVTTLGKSTLFGQKNESLKCMDCSHHLSPLLRNKHGAIKPDLSPKAHSLVYFSQVAKTAATVVALEN